MNSAKAVNVYAVPIYCEVHACVTGYVDVFAASPDEAESKVQAKIDADTLDHDIEMEDADNGFTMSYGDVLRTEGLFCQVLTNEIQVNEGVEADPADVLDEEVEELRAAITWDVQKQSKLKAFLETLQNA